MEKTSRATSQANHSAEFRRVLGSFCTGVVVVTGMHEGRPRGFTAQSFVSLSLDPPLIAVCPSCDSRSWPLIRGARAFGINVLALGQSMLCRRFARSAEDKFEGVQWSPAPSGNPILRGSLAFIDCTLEAEHAAGDHTIVIGRVRALEDLAQEQPLLFFRGRIVTPQRD